jgi:hypothetical protein
VEEVVAILAGNLDVHEAETFSREDRLLTFVADDPGPEFHGIASWRMALFVLLEISETEGKRRHRPGKTAEVEKLRLAGQGSCGNGRGPGAPLRAQKLPIIHTLDSELAPTSAR